MLEMTFALMHYYTRVFDLIYVFSIILIGIILKGIPGDVSA